MKRALAVLVLYLFINHFAAVNGTGQQPAQTPTASQSDPSNVRKEGRLGRGFSLSMEVKPANPLDWYPLQVGNRWIYDCSNLSGDPGHPVKKTWSTEIIVTRHYKIKEGLVVVASVVDRPHVEFKSKTAIQYLIRGGYIYDLPLDPKTHQSEEAYWKERLEKGVFEPEFFFPLQDKLLFAARLAEEDVSGANCCFYLWMVNAPDEDDKRSVPAKFRENLFKLAYFSVGGPGRVLFQKGTGVIREWNHHSGSIWDNDQMLREFIPAKKP